MAAEYICRAQDAITFKIVSSASDIDHGPGFHPVFTHQLFDDEQIRGGLLVVLSAAPRIVMNSYISHRVQEPERDNSQVRFANGNLPWDHVR